MFNFLRKYLLRYFLSLTLKILEAKEMRWGPTAQANPIENAQCGFALGPTEHLFTRAYGLPAHNLYGVPLAHYHSPLLHLQYSIL